MGQRGTALSARTTIARPCAEAAGRGTRASQAQHPDAAPHDGDAGSDERQRQGRAGYPWTQQGRYARERLHAVDRSQRQADAGGNLLRADGAAAIGGSIVKARNLVRFGTVGCFGRSASDCPQTVGRLTQR